MHITGSTIHPEKSTADILGTKVEEAHTSAYYYVILDFKEIQDHFDAAAP